MSIFPKIKDMNPQDVQSTREVLLRYCELDTWAVVKFLEKLKKLYSATECIWIIIIFAIIKSGSQKAYRVGNNRKAVFPRNMIT